MKNLCISLFIVALLSACGSDYEESQVSGTYGGESWEGISAVASATTNLTGDAIFSFSISDKLVDGDPCSTSNDGNTFLTTCPQVIGEYEFGIFKARFGTFYVDGTNILSNEGAIEILEIDEEAGEVKARVWCENDENNKISGIFTAVLCK